MSAVGQQPGNIAAMAGSRVVFQCASNGNNQTRWDYYPHGLNQPWTIFNGERMDSRFGERFSVDARCARGRCDLTIREVQSRDAGYFVCFEPSKSIRHSAALVVLGRCAMAVGTNSFRWPYKSLWGDIRSAKYSRSLRLLPLLLFYYHHHQKHHHHYRSHYQIDAGDNGLPKRPAADPDTTRTLLTSSASTLVIPRTRTDIARWAFSVAAPSIWNSLPADVRLWQSLSPTFKRHLKTRDFERLIF